MVKKLTELTTGERGVIISFDNDELTIKLMEMGCVPGEEIKINNIAPLGDPISIQITGYNLSLRINEAESIMVETLN
jgi:ferrous iron transport protein A